MKARDLGFLVALTLSGLGIAQASGETPQSNSNQASQTTQPARIETAKPQLDAKAQEELKRLNEKYGFLDVYDSAIDKSISYFSARLNLNDIKRNTIKAQIFDETGGKQYRQTAFKFDPMQIANKGDCALTVLVNKEENTGLLGDFSCLEGKTHTPRKNGKWDYSNSNMTGELSIYGGIGWDLRKRANFATRVIEEGELEDYTIQSGDSFNKIARTYGTTVSTIQKYNPKVSSKKLKIGEKIKLRKARNETYVESWKTMDEALVGYNGGGDPKYLEKIKKFQEELDRWDVLKTLNSRDKT